MRDAGLGFGRCERRAACVASFLFTLLILVIGVDAPDRSAPADQAASGATTDVRQANALVFTEPDSDLRVRTRPPARRLAPWPDDSSIVRLAAVSARFGPMRPQMHLPSRALNGASPQHNIASRAPPA